MKSNENFIIRRQVPETDPVYQKERLIRRSDWGKSFGRQAVYNYRNAESIAQGIIESRDSLQQRLGAMIDQDNDDARKLKEEIEAKTKWAENIINNKEKGLREDFSKLTSSLNRFFQRNRLASTEEYVLQEAKLMFLQVPQVNEGLRKFFGDDVPWFDFHEKVYDGTFPAELLCLAAEKHLESIEKQETQLEELVLKTKLEFKHAIEEAVEKGELPLSAAKNLSRLDDLRVELFDSLKNIGSNTNGFHSGTSGQVVVASENLLPQKISQLRKTLIHEFFHDISGWSITIAEPKDATKDTSKIALKKTGISINSEQVNYSQNRWINEAVTEWLTLKYSGFSDEVNSSDYIAYKGSGSYPDERKELDRLFADGLSEKVVTEAYFENFSSDQSKEETGKHFTNLLRHINELEGPYGFTKLENKFILNDVGEWLREEFAGYLQFDNQVGIPQGLKPGSKLVTIKISVGVDKSTVSTGVFSYVVEPLTTTEGRILITADMTLERHKDIFAEIKNRYGGKLSYSIEQKDVEGV